MTFRFFLPSPRRNDITERVLMERAAKMREQRDAWKSLAVREKQLRGEKS